MRKKITAKELTKAKFDKALNTYLMTDISGMYVSVRVGVKGNQITFQWRKCANGKRICKKIGEFPAMSIDEARLRFAKMNRDFEMGELVLDNVNANPKFKKAMTFKECWDKWRTNARIGISYNTEKKYTSVWNIHLNKIANVEVKNITPKFVLDFIQPYIERGDINTAHRVADNIRSCLDYAVFLQEIEFNSLLTISKYLPKEKIKHIPAFDIESLEQDMIELFASFRSESQDLQNLLLMYFYTLLRSVELRSLLVDNVHDDYFEVKTKTWDCFRVPVTKQMRAILDYQISNKKYTSGFVFEGRLGCIYSENTLNKALSLHGYKDKLRVHGIRSCGRQWLQTLDYAKESIIELCLSHVAGNKVQQAYNRGTYLEERRKIMTEWNNFVEQCYLKSLTMNS